jgi:hypothetical protein
MLAADVRTDDSVYPTWKGGLMALVFGLVHGLGFAGGLREIGLPERAVPQALAAFGVGVEIGQVAFLLIVLTALHVARNARSLPRYRLGVVYAAGIVGSFWLFERVMECVAWART